MKQLSIIIVTYNWPPRNAIGTHRPYSWAKYWTAAGARVSVLTAAKYGFDEPLDLQLPELPGVEVLEVPYFGSAQKKYSLGRWNTLLLSVLKRAKNAMSRHAGLILDPRDGWYHAALASAIDQAKKIGATVIVSTHGPRSSHLIAAGVKRALPHLFWVADYRDLWSQSHLLAVNRRGRDREARRELATVGALADLLTTVSGDLATELASFLGKKAAVVANGFDVPLTTLSDNFSWLDNIGERTTGRPFRIVYTGMIYPGRRDPRPLFSAINGLIAEGRIEAGDIVVDFYGKTQSELDGMANSMNASAFVRIHGHVARHVALEAQASADLLLLLESGASDAKGVLTGKLFEYMASGRPVLSLGSTAESAIGQMLGRCGVGLSVGEDVDRIQRILMELQSGRIPSWFKPALDAIKLFSRESQAAVMLQMIAVEVDAPRCGGVDADAHCK